MPKKNGKRIQSLATHRTSSDPNSLRFQVAKKKAKGTQLSTLETGEESESRKWNIKDRCRAAAHKLPDARAKSIWTIGS